MFQTAFPHCSAGGVASKDQESKRARRLGQRAEHDEGARAHPHAGGWADELVG